MFSKRTGILIGQGTIIIGLLFGNVLLMMAGALVLVNEIYKENSENPPI